MLPLLQPSPRHQSVTYPNLPGHPRPMFPLCSNRINNLAHLYPCKQPNRINDLRGIGGTWARGPGNMHMRTLATLGDWVMRIAYGRLCSATPSMDRWLDIHRSDTLCIHIGPSQGEIGDTNHIIGSPVQDQMGPGNVPKIRINNHIALRVPAYDILSPL
jgi:hypothetical protein